MKAEELGFNLETGTHSRAMTRSENLFLGVMWTDHVGKTCKLSADELAVRWYAAMSDISPDDDEINVWVREIKKIPAFLEQLKRDVRTLHNHMLERHDQVPILSSAGVGGGYWIAETEAEAVAFYDTFRKRGLTGLRKASRGRKAALIDMMQQLSFEFDELTDKTDYAGFVRRNVETPTPIDVVDAFLERMMGNPEKFSDGLRKIGQKYGSILLPKDRMLGIKTKAAELAAMMEGIV